MDDSPHQRVLIDLKLDDGVELQLLLVEHGLQRLGLGDRAREPVENEALRGIRLRDPVADDADDDLVRDEAAGFHHRLGLEATGVPAATAARSMSPVESWTMPCFTTQTLRLRALPLRRVAPAKSISSALAPPQLGLLHEALILMREQIPVHLGHCIHRD